MRTIKKDLRHAAGDVEKSKSHFKTIKRRIELLNSEFQRRRREVTVLLRSLRNCLCVNVLFQFNVKSLLLYMQCQDVLLEKTTNVRIQTYLTPSIYFLNKPHQLLILLSLGQYSRLCVSMHMLRRD